tara:strand:- start:20 stop:511 length:492 start_codon:yes stop_codon:yes gene_type:complete
MIIRLKNKDTLIVEDFKLKCCIGKKGLKKLKIEGDSTTPIGTFTLGNLYFRDDRNRIPQTKLKKKIIKKNMIWCDDPKNKNYNKEIIKTKNMQSEKLFRKDNKYDYLIIINYNRQNIIPYKGSAIFIHLTDNYDKTKGCIALKKKDFLILAKLINKKTKIKIS